MFVNLLPFFPIRLVTLDEQSQHWTKRLTNDDTDKMLIASHTASFPSILALTQWSNILEGRGFFPDFFESL